MRSPAVFRWFVVGNFATVLIVAFLAMFAHAEGLDEETSRLVERLNFRSSDKEFTFPAGPDEVSEICERLYEIGPEARAAIPTLIKSLADDERNWSASFALTGISGEAVPALRRALKVKQGDTRLMVIATLGDIGRDASAAIPDLIGLLRNNDLETRSSAIDALTEIDPSSPEAVLGISALLWHESEDTRSKAASALGVMQSANQAMPSLVKAATTGAPADVRAHALNTLAHVDRNGQQAADALVEALPDNEGDAWFTIGRRAAYELAGMGRRAAPAVPSLVEMCNTNALPDDESILLHVIEVFANNPDVSAASEPFLRRILVERFDAAVQRNDHDTVETCVASATPLLRIRPLDQQARNIVISVLKDPRWKAPGVRSVFPGVGDYIPDPRPSAAGTVASLRPKARDVLPVLKGLLAEGRGRKHEQLAICAGWAIAHLDHDDNTCIPEVIRYIEQLPCDQPQSPTQCAEAIKPRIEQCLPVLLNRLYADDYDLDRDRRRKAYLMEVIVAMGDEPISQVIERCLKAAPQRPWERGDDAWQNVYAEFEVLPLLGNRAQPAMPKLLANLHDEDHLTRARSAEMLGRLKLDAEKVVPELIARLDDERAIVRARAAAAIGSFGRDAISAVEPLQAAQNDSYLVVRTSARQSLSSIQSSGVV